MTLSSHATSALWALAFVCSLAAGEPNATTPTPSTASTMVCDDTRMCSAHGTATPGDDSCVCNCEEKWYGETCDTHIAGVVSIGIGVIAPVLVLVATAISLTYLHSRKILDRADTFLTIEIFVSAGDFASDFFWVLTESFYAPWIVICAACCLFAPGLIFVSWNYVHYIKFSVWVRKAPKTLRDIYARSRLAPDSLCRSLREHNICQFFADNSALEFFVVNLVATAIVVSAVPLAMLAGGLFFLGCVATLGALCVMYHMFLFLFTMYLHASRLLALGNLHGRLAQLWGCHETKGGVAVAEPVAEPDAKEGVNLVEWHRVVIFEVLFESTPQVALNSTNMAFMAMKLGAPPSWIAISSTVMSVYIALRLGWRYFYWIICKRKSLSDIPLGGEKRAPRRETGSGGGTAADATPESARERVAGIATDVALTGLDMAASLG